MAEKRFKRSLSVGWFVSGKTAGEEQQITMNSKYFQNCNNDTVHRIKNQISSFSSFTDVNYRELQRFPRVKKEKRKETEVSDLKQIKSGRNEGFRNLHVIIYKERATN